MENQSDKDKARPDHLGIRTLIDQYNVNDQAHSDSSTDDFVKTVSGFTHADGSTGTKDEESTSNLKNTNHEKTN